MANTRFDWDTDKDAKNQQKHGVSFSRAQHAFADPQRVIAKDITHSQTEERFYCFGAGYWRKGKAIYEHENQTHG